MASSGKEVAPVARRLNAVLAALLTAFFFGHAVLGAASQSTSVLADAVVPTILIWSFAGIACLHAAASVLTTYLMLTDEARPPSPRKRAHQWLKWATGGALALVAAFHALCPAGQLAPALLAVLAALLWHAYVGCKSLVRDLGLPHSFKLGLRALVLLAAVAAALILAAPFAAGQLAAL